MVLRVVLRRRGVRPAVGLRAAPLFGVAAARLVVAVAVLKGRHVQVGVVVAVVAPLVVVAVRPVAGHPVVEAVVVAAVAVAVVVVDEVRRQDVQQRFVGEVAVVAPVVAAVDLLRAALCAVVDADAGLRIAFVPLLVVLLGVARPLQARHRLAVRVELCLLCGVVSGRGGGQSRSAACHRRRGPSPTTHHSYW